MQRQLAMQRQPLRPGLASFQPLLSIHQLPYQQLPHQLHSRRMLHQQPCLQQHHLQQQQQWQPILQQQHSSSSTICRSSAAAYGNSSSSSNDSNSLVSGITNMATEVKELSLKFISLWRQFLPMLSLFFCLSFVNTMLDSLKDTLVITAVGGGAFVIPYLTVYAVLPVSVVFLFLFSTASHTMSRSALFNTIIGAFMAFFGVFAVFLYPNADVLHPHALADSLQQVLPQGLSGLVGMLRNWTFTLFFCMSELWGDVCMGLLFWGLANEITSLSDAATLYPLFGLGANLAQALAGIVLKATTRVGAEEFKAALQLSMAAVIGIGAVAICLQQKITNDAAAAAAAAAAAKRHRHRHNSSNPPHHPPGPHHVPSLEAHQSSNADHNATAAAAAALHVAAAAAAAAEDVPAAAVSKPSKSAKPKPSAWESLRVLGNSLEIRCLAIMSLAQGLCNSLVEFAWKCHMRILYPSPADFTAFLGDVATWSGVVTGGLMLLSPLLFDRWGWRGVANATPNIFLFGGSAFFVTCIAYQQMFGAAAAAGGAAAAGPASLLMLQVLVMSGALLYVFSKGAKFSLFKPAEEMVYITLDEDGRTRGKAAIDVVGSQTGKSGGSLLQQALLLVSAGSITGSIMPVMFAVFFIMLRGWRAAVHDLSQVRSYSYDSPTTSMEEESEESGLSADNVQALQHKLKELGTAAAAAGAEVHHLDSSSSSSGGGGGDGMIGSRSYRAAVARTSGSSSSSGSSSNGRVKGSVGIRTADLNGASSTDTAAAGGGKDVGRVAVSDDAEAAFLHSLSDNANSSSSSSSGTGTTSSSSSSNAADVSSKPL